MADETHIDGSEMPLAVAAQRLGLRRPRAYDDVLTGRLDGRKLANGHWVVTAASVARYEQDRLSASGNAA